MRIPRYVCRSRNLILLIIAGSMMSFYIVIVKKSSVSDMANYVDEPSCSINDINPFSDEIMKYMHDFGEHKCTPNNDAQISVTLNNIQVNGSGIDFVRTREIIDDTKYGFSFKDFVYLEHLKKSSPTLYKGKSGAIKNEASKRCIIPGKYNPSAPPDQIEVVFSKKCDTEFAGFSYTNENLIIHKLTKKCLGPKDGLKNPPKNTQLVLSKHCEAKFDVINEGVLQMVGGGSCIHPLWGGESPEEGQKLCLYPSCNPEKRLKYRWFFKYTGGKKITNKRFTLDKDMNHVQVQLLNDNMVNTYVLSIRPRLTPTISTTTPSIIVISIEEASAPHFKRKLPNTFKAMTKMGFVEYKYHAAVSPTSSANFMTMLNGHSSSEGNTEGSIFQLAKKFNYVTMFSADDPLNAEMGKVADVDHNSLPFFRTIKQKFNIAAQTYCLTGQPIYDITFNYLLSFLTSYPSHAMLAVVLLSEISRVNFNYLGYMDKHFTSLLDQLSSLKNTIIFVQTLKGGESGKLGQLLQGVEEIKRPLLATYVSEDIRNKYNFETTRSSQLSTSYDTYVTLRHLISQEKQKHDHGKSLLTKLKPRNCIQAAVYPSMCPCV